jgi:tight adherence protein B
MRTGFVAVIGAITCVLAARAARRLAVRDRLRERAAPRPIPGRLARPLARALDAAALDVSIRQALHAWILAGLIGGVLGIGVDGLATGIVGSGGVLTAAPIVLFSARHRRARRLASAVPATIERVAAELRAGGTVTTAVVAVAAGDNPLARDLARVDARMRLGASLTGALQAWASERPVVGVDAAAGALAMCSVVGGRAADALDGLASSLRDRLAVIAEARALSSQARMSAIVIGGAPLVFLVWSAIADPHTLHGLGATAVGRVCIVVGLALEGLGLWWMRRILRAGSIW